MLNHPLRLIGLLSQPKTFLKHGFCELLFVLIPEPLEGDVAEVGEEDESVPGEVIAEVHQLLLHRVQAQALERRQQVPRCDARLPDPRLKLPEYYLMEFLCIKYSFQYFLNTVVTASSSLLVRHCPSGSGSH